MLNAKQARELSEAMTKQGVEVVLYNILRDVAEQALDSRGRTYVYADLDYVDERVDYVVNRLRDLGYTVEVSKYPEDLYSSLTVRF